MEMRTVTRTFHIEVTTLADSDEYQLHRALRDKLEEVEGELGIIESNVEFGSKEVFATVAQL